MRSALKNYPFHIRPFKHKPAIKTAKDEVMPEETKLIQPVPVVRDEYGMFAHPDAVQLGSTVSVPAELI